MSDALERLKNRNRPTVPNRDASLELSSPDISTSSIQDSKKSRRSEKSLTTKQSTIRLEAGLSDRLQKICHKSEVSREVFIEAMFEYCEKNSPALQAVLEEAKQKNSHRQQVANLRRAKSMMQRFGEAL
jgi:hypothetical protein